MLSAVNGINIKLKAPDDDLLTQTCYLSVSYPVDMDTDYGTVTEPARTRPMSSAELCRMQMLFEKCFFIPWCSGNVRLLQNTLYTIV